MKQFISLFKVSLLLVLLFASFISKGQASHDVVTMTNGETKTGKVTAVTDKKIKFTYSGETLEYEIDKSAIANIRFASGRVETFGTTPAPAANDQPAASPASNPASTAETRKNKVAVIPFEIITNDPALQSEAYSREIQQACVNAIRSQAPNKTLQDPMTTNTILAKHQVNAGNIIQYSPGDLAKLLDVELVVIGSFSIQNKGTTSSTSTYGNFDTKKDEKKDKTKGTVYGSSNTSTSTNYATKLNVKVFNDAGNSIYSETHAPAFGGIDSYKPGLKYMMKRSVFKKG